MLLSVEKDLRNVKTQRALNNAMLALLERHKFAKITVRYICEEALISRATFYAHFLDKYDFLKYWLTLYIPENMNIDENYEHIESMANEFVRENKTVIKNIFCDANSETLDILFDVILATLKLDVEEMKDSSAYTKYTVLSNIIAGGLIYYSLWQVKNNFPMNVNPMNTDLYCVMKNFRNATLCQTDIVV